MNYIKWVIFTDYGEFKRVCLWVNSRLGLRNVTAGVYNRIKKTDELVVLTASVPRKIR